MGLALVSMLLAYGTLDLHRMVEWQSSAAGMWGCVMNPIGALIFWICTFAETNRLPFDLPEGEAEIVAGFHVEYGSMKFALFFLAEYVAMIMASALLATVFFGGYSLLPGFSYLVGWVSSAQEWPLQNVKAFFEFASLFLKVAFFIATLPKELSGHEYGAPFYVGLALLSILIGYFNMALSTYPAEWISIRVSSFIRNIICLFNCPCKKKFRRQYMSSPITIITKKNPNFSIQVNSFDPKFLCNQTCARTRMKHFPMRHKRNTLLEFIFKRIHFF
jgi:hypothetical protein